MNFLNSSMGALSGMMAAGPGAAMGNLSEQELEMLKQQMMSGGMGAMSQQDWEMIRERLQGIPPRAGFTPGAGWAGANAQIQSMAARAQARRAARKAEMEAMRSGMGARTTGEVERVRQNVDQVRPGGGYGGQPGGMSFGRLMDMVGSWGR